MMPRMAEPNPDRRELFIAEYLKDCRPTSAARRAGWPPSTAASAACRMLQEPEVAQRVKLALAERMSRVMSADEVLTRLTRIASVDMNDLVELRVRCCRHCWGLDFKEQRTAGEMRMARARHAKEVKRSERMGTDLVEDIGEFDELGGIGFDRTALPNPDCPECNGEGVTVTAPKDTRDLSPEALAVYAGVKVTKDGIELKTRDQDKALELLARHHGLLNDKLNLGLPDLANAIANARGRS